MRASVAIGVLASILSLAASARADPRYRVVLLKPPVTDDVTSDALARVHGELTAAGFDVSVLAQDPALDVRSALETVARELDPIAAFAIVRAAGGNTAEIWVCDRIAGKSVIQSVRLDGGGDAGRAIALGRAGGAGRRATEGQPGAVLAGVDAPLAARARDPGGQRTRTRRVRDRRASASGRASAGWTASAR